MKKLSFCSWAFVVGPYANHPVAFEHCVKRVAEAGYQAIEVGAVPHHVTLESCPTPETREAVRQLIADNGLEVSAFVCSQYDVDPTEEANKQRYLDKFARHLELALAIGAKDLRLDSVAPPEKYPDPAERQAAADRLAEVFPAAAEQAHSAGARVHWEFDPGMLCNKPSEIVDLAGKVPHEAFGVLFDTANACLCSVFGARQVGEKEALEGGGAELLQRLAGRVTALHLGDADGTLYGNLAGVHAPFGTGFVNVRGLMPHLLALENIDTWTVDSSFWPGAWELAEAQAGYLRKAMERATAQV